MAFAAILMAGLDGIERKLAPGKALDALEQVDPVRLRPHPYEFCLHYDA